MATDHSSVDVRAALVALCGLDFGPRQLAYLSGVRDAIIAAIVAGDALALAAQATSGVNSALQASGAGVVLSAKTLRTLLGDGWDLIDRALGGRVAAVARLRERVTALQGGSHFAGVVQRNESAPAQPATDNGRQVQPERAVPAIAPSRPAVATLRNVGYKLPYDWSQRSPAPRRHDRSRVRTINNGIGRSMRSNASDTGERLAEDSRPVTLRVAARNSAPRRAG